MDARNGHAEIQLNPPSLGTLRVSVALANGNLTAQFDTQSEMVRQLLNSQMDRLRTVLEGQGITVDRLAVRNVETAPAAPTAYPVRPKQNRPRRSIRTAAAVDRRIRIRGMAKVKIASGSFAAVWRQTRQPIDLVA